ncbi:MAG: isoleucine--tRNA ligase, partial [Candidatus Dadabacteria bacterium]
MEAVKPGVNFPELEKDILNFWSTNNTFKRSLEIRENCPKYTFYDGPPFATGTPHYGHLFQGTIKDIIPRYQTMKGFYVERRFGWDTHGLPIEMLIEQELGLKGRKEIIEYGVDKFNQKCRESVLKYAKEWERITTRLGRWIDFENDYKTMDLSFMESVWWVFKTLWDRGRIYKGLRVVPYSWRLSTPLSNFEVGLNYQTVQDPSITVALRLTKPQEEETYALIWTTTPWTLPSNIAVCVGPDITYSLIKIKEGKSKGAKFLLATERVPSYFSEGSFETVKTFKGTELAGWKYEPLFDYYRDLEKKGCFVFLVDDYVTVEEGTGIVHQSPAHGEDDFRVCTKAGLPVVDPVDDEGCFQDPVTDLKGKNIKEADKEIIKKIKEKGLLFKYETIEHSYPFCWRSDTPLIYKAISAWYVKVEDLREKLLKANSLIHWVPEHVKEGRFGKWLEQARDWNISRNRFWGNPLPVWECTECSNTECLGSRSELEEKCKEKVEDLHKHFVDKLSWSCAQCGKGTMKRVPEVLDCWFESGSMPYAYLHYPFENEDVFKESFPADFIGEAMDQTRGWFYTLLVLSVSLFNKPAYKNVITTGIVLAEDGKKMSKRLKNYPDPMYLMDKYGADALRLYMINSAVLKGETLRFSERGVKEIVRTVLLPYWNAYSFFTTYAVVDSYVPSLKVESGKLTPPQSSNMLDRWIISRLQTLLSLIEEEMGRYHLYQVVPKLISFLDELTNWYVRRSRRRFWSNNLEDKQQGYDTFFYVLLNFTKALAPFLPFVTEAIFKNLSTL